MVNGIARVAPYRDLGRPPWGEWVGVERGCVSSRDVYLCRLEPVGQENLIRIHGVLQVNSAVRYPAHFQLAVLPEGCFGRQVPLPTVGLLRAGVEPLVGHAAQGSSKCTTRGHADILATGISPGKIVSGRLNKRSRSVQGPHGASSHTKRRVVGAHADGQQPVTGFELAHSRADREPSRAKYIPGDAQARHNHMIVVVNQRAVLENGWCSGGTDRGTRIGSALRQDHAPATVVGLK